MIKYGEKEIKSTHTSNSELKTAKPLTLLQTTCCGGNRVYNLLKMPKLHGLVTLERMYADFKMKAIYF